MRSHARTLAATLAAGALAVSLAACGSSSTGSSSTGASTSASADSKAPILTVPALKGVETSVTLERALPESDEDSRRLVDEFGVWADLGVQQLVLDFGHPRSTEPVLRFAEQVRGAFGS